MMMRVQPPLRFRLLGGGWALGNFSHTMPVSSTVQGLTCAIWQILAQCFL